MAATRINLVQAVRTGVDISAGTAADAANGNVVANDGRLALLCKNTGGTPYTVTVAFAEKVDGQTVAPRVVSLAAGAFEALGPYPPDEYGDQLSVTAENAAVTIVPLHL